MTIRKIIYRFKEDGLVLTAKSIVITAYNKLFRKEPMQIISLLNKKKFAKAAEVCSMFLAHHPNDIQVLRQYAFAKYYMGNSAEATALMRSALELHTSTSVDDLVKKIPFAEYETEYVYNGGNSNWGAFIHRPIQGKNLPSLYSKIVTDTKNREIFFYENIDRRLLVLSEIPEYHGSYKISGSGIVLITNTFFNNTDAADIPLDCILKANQKIESIPYKQCLNLFKKSGFYTSKYYAMYLNKPNVLAEVIQTIDCVVKPSEFGLDVNLKDLFITSKLYKKIIPEKHYAFCHNDFHKNNIKVDDVLNTCYIFDWENYSYSIKGWDMAYFFGDFKYDFEQILDCYIKHKSDPVEQIFYVLMQLFIWTRRLNGRDWREKAVSHFIPAMEYLKKTCEECADA